MNRRVVLTLMIIGIPLLLGFAADIVQKWDHIFDDAFITYRYAKNLADGHGITWNPGMAPTEGYTNFLLVILLTPFIYLGYDPLVVTRLLSYLWLRSCSQRQRADMVPQRRLRPLSQA